MIKRDVELANSLALAARARYYIEAQSTEDLRSARACAAQEDLPILILGGGTNVVLPEAYQGLVVKIADQHCDVMSESENDVVISCGAGMDWQSLVLWCYERGYHGLENLAFIPGSVGAAPVQNIGAYGVELSDFVVGVRCYDFAAGLEHRLSASECEFAYRYSVFKKQKQLGILALELRLSQNFAPQLGYAGLRDSYPSARALIEHIGAVRRSKLPDINEHPNVGSFFCNPVVDAASYQRLREHYPELRGFAQADSRVKLSAAQLLQLADYRGRSNPEQTLAMSAQHALVLTNLGAATQQQLLHFVATIQHDIKARFGLRLLIEPEIVPSSVK